MQFLLALFPVFVCSSFTLQKHLDRHEYFFVMEFSLLFLDLCAAIMDRTTFYSPGFESSNGLQIHGLKEFEKFQAATSRYLTPAVSFKMN
jgi:hypothetical protein